MPKVKDVSRSAQKWAERAGAASSDYVSGVQAPRADWQSATASSQENYKQAVTKAANEGRFARGVNAAGTQKWQQNAIAKGAQRFSSGVAVAQPDYASGVEPFLRVIEAVSLPPRKPKGDPSNIQRVAAMATALHSAKTGRSGGR